MTIENRWAATMSIMLTISLLGCAAHGPLDLNETAEKEASPTCTVDRSRAHELLNSTLWMQMSAEYEIATLQIFRQAREQLDAALADPTRSAALEQNAHYKDKPPAVIMDIDETVLDNSPLAAQLILNGTSYLPEHWSEWVATASATWVQGAKEFIDYAQSKNTSVIFITNRTKDEETNTRRNFERLGYKVSATPDYMLTKKERDNWTSDKTTRRAYVAENFRILLLIGDDLNDFVFASGTTAERRQAMLPHALRFGIDWFLIPNPSYGSWERALHSEGDDCATLDEKRSRLRGVR